MRDLTEIVLVLDKSGSMSVLKNDTIGSVNKFIEDQRAVPGDANLTLIVFDTIVKPVFWRQPIAKAGLLNSGNYRPDGGTALLDAMGYGIEELGRRLAAEPESERPNKVIFAVMTDGEENSSRLYDRDGVFNRVRHQTEKYSWQFVFLGANQDAIQAGTKYGFAAANCMTYSASSEGVSSYNQMLGTNVAMYRMSAKSDMSFTVDQLKQTDDILKKDQNP